MSRPILKGAVDQSTVIHILNTDGTPKTDAIHSSAGLDLYYRREGAALVSLTEVTQTVGGAHADGGFIHIGAGYYRVDPPDAAFASGADGVLVAGSITGGVVVGVYHELIDAVVSNQNGLPLLRDNTAQSATSSTIVLDTGASAVDDFYNGCFITAAGQTRQIIDYVGATKTATIYVAGPPVQGGQWVTTPSGGGLAYQIHGFAITPTAVTISGGEVAATLSATQTAAIADKVLDRAIQGGADGGRTVTRALRRISNRRALVGTTLTTYREDDTTSDHTDTVTLGTRDPINSTDPA